MVTALVAMALVSQATQYDAAFSERLVKWRGQFDSVLEEPKEDIGHIHVYSETLGPFHADAFYPIGSASERFVIATNSNEGKVIFESRHGDTARVDWYAPVVAAKKKRQVKGTIPKYLMSQGMEISPRAKLSKAIRKKLMAEDAFAGFLYHSMQGGYAWIVKSDGTCLPTHRSNDVFSIIPEENELLRDRVKKR